MNDIQSWWEVPSIAHFCSLFRTAFNLLDFDIEDLEEALLTDGTEETSWLQELIVRLLTGCLPNNEISTFNYQMFLRRLFREKCKEHDRYNPFNTDIDFQLLPLRTKVDILHALCDFRLDAEDVLEQLKNLEADSLRVEPLGYDNNDSAYWYFYGTRLYREDFKTKNNKKGKSVWQVVCFTEDDWFQLAKKFKKSQSKSERQLYRTLTENFLPELPRLFCEKERLARKRLLENQPRRTSSRLDTKRKQELEEQAEKAKLEPISEKDQDVDDEQKKKKDLEQRRQEAYERRARLRERAQVQDQDQDQESGSEKSKSRYEMAGNKKRDKKSKTKQRPNSNSSSSSRDRGSSITRSSTRGSSRGSARNAEKPSKNAEKPCKNTEKLSRNTEKLSRNTEKTSKNTEKTGRNIEKTTRNTEKTTRNAEKTTRNTEKTTRNTEKTSRNTEKTTRNTEKITKNTEKATKNTEKTSKNTDNISSNTEKTGTSTTSTRSSNVSTFTAVGVGRQTNNSLASATGQILIQPVSNPHRKKLKTSQVFCQTDEDLQTGMHKILDYVKNHEDAWPFVDPVEEEFAPNYYSIIRKPMDLQRMEERLDSGYYKSFSRFRGDFQLIVDNCRLYNGVDNEYTEMVGNLLTVFEKATERYLDQVTSSDEEIAVEYPKAEADEKVVGGNKQKKSASSTSSSRKPTLAAQTDKKREPSISEDSTSKRSNSLDSFDQIKNEKKQVKGKTVEESKIHKKNPKPVVKAEEKPDKKKNKKNSKVGRKPTRFEPSPVRTRSRSRSYSSFSRDDWSSSPPPSWPPSSPGSPVGSAKRKNTKSSHLSDEESRSKFKGREKQKDKWKDVIKDDFDKRNDKKYSKAKDRSLTPPKQKDKHNKLRETIEKLKAKSELSNKLKDCDDSDNDKAKENRISARDDNNKNKKYDLHKNVLKNKAKRKNEKRNLDLEDENSTADSVQSDNKKHLKKESSKNLGTKNAAIEALTLATEQTLKDINKWLDDTPRLSEFSSASNSPSHYIGAEEFDSIGSKIEHDYRKRLEKPLPRKDGIGKDIKRRTFHRDPTKFLKKREVQRTIDRLQPGKSKGNLLSNIQNTNKADDIFPLGPLSKMKDTKNSLIVKTDESTPKLSLGSVLDSFGKHKFVDDVKKDEDSDKNLTAKKESCDPFVPKLGNAGNSKTESTKVTEVGDVKEEKSEVKIPVSEPGPGKATPNLSAWFKAFGAPKVPPNQKKTESKLETKEPEKTEETSTKQQGTQEQKSKDESRKIAPPDISPNPDSPATPQGQPAQRQRKMSTGSTVSERSSFSQDMDSPRVGIDERLGAYPAPYPSPLHRSPSGASPIMASPRPDVSPKSTYPTVNGQIRVGFYQDTVSTKSSPDKSCSPKENPQSPYPQYSEHVYTPSTTESATYAYNNPSYYSQMPNYSNPTTPSYNPEQTNPSSYYDTNKPLTDQYQAKAAPGYHSVNSPNFQNVNSPNYSANSPSYHSNVTNSPSYHPTNSPASNVTQLPSPAAQQQQAPGYDTFRQQQTTRLPEKQQTAMFPVKKRAYNESDSPQLPNANQQQEQQSVYDRNYELSLMSGRQLTIGATNQPPQAQEVRPSSRSTPQQYVHQNIPNPRSSNTQNQNSADSFAKANVPQAVQASNPVRDAAATLQQPNQETMHNVNSFGAPTNLYNYNNETAYPINVPSELPLDLNARPDADKKMDMSKYTNMGYTGPDMGFARNPQYNRVDLNYGRSAIPSLTGKSTELQTPTPANAQNLQNSEMMMRYTDAGDYRNADMNTPSVVTQKPSHVTNLNMPQNAENRLNPALDVSSGYKPEMSIPRPGYSSATALNVDQSLGLRGNLTNLSHIVDRFSTENMYYGEKGLPAPHIYSKPMVTSASSLPMFSQSNIAMPYGHEMQANQSSMYNRQMTELQNSMANQSKTTAFPQQQQQPQQQQPPEKKSKRRKSSKTAAAPTSSVETAVSSASNQGFQSYTGLKNTATMEPSAISLKTASVVPGSAFNFGPAPSGLGLSSGLYGDKDTYPNFLEDYRTAPNYYMAAAAAAAHHRSTPDTGDKQARTAHQPSASAAAGYPFIGTPQARPPSYPLSGPFMPPHQAPPLMDASSPLYQQYLQAGVLHQGLLGPPGAYPPGYHPALSMRQPFDSMTRPSWL